MKPSKKFVLSGHYAVKLRDGLFIPVVCTFVGTQRSVLVASDNIIVYTFDSLVYEGRIFRVESRSWDKVKT